VALATKYLKVSVLIICIMNRFLAINAVTTTCKSPHTKEGMSPEAHYGDGNTDLIIVSGGFFTLPTISDSFKTFG
jgi:hypothetical protein